MIPGVPEGRTKDDFSTLLTRQVASDANSLKTRKETSLHHRDHRTPLFDEERLCTFGFGTHSATRALS
jgi:hypothetical protein